MREVNALYGAGSSRTFPSGHNTVISLSPSATSPSVTTPLFSSADIPIFLLGVVSASEPELTGGVGKVPYANADSHGLPFYTKRRKAPRFSSDADLTSSTRVNVSDSPQGGATSLPDQEDRIAMVCNSVLKPSDLCHGSPNGFDLSHLASVTAASRRRKAYQANIFSTSNVVGLTPVLPVPSTGASDTCCAPYLRSSEIGLPAPEAEVSPHSTSVEEFETSEIVSADWDEESVCDCSLEEDHDVRSVSESKPGMIDNIQESRTSWVEFLDSGSISPALGIYHMVDGGTHGIFSIESSKRYHVVNSDVVPPCPRKAVTTGNSRRHMRIYGNLLEQQNEDTSAVHLEQDYGFKALPDILEQESGLLPDCTRYSGLRALVLPNLVAQRTSAGSNLPLDSPEPLDSSSIVSASPEMEGLERSGDAVPVLKSGGLESLRALIAALESVSLESQSSNMGLSPSMLSPTSDFSLWDEDSASEANVSWGIAT